MIGGVWAALWSHWRRHPGQLVTLIAGLALATALWSAVQAINAEARASYDEAAALTGSGDVARLTSATGTIPLARYLELRRAGWQVAAALEGRARLGTSWVTVLGVDLLSYPALPALASDETLTPADLFTAPGRLFVRPDLARGLASVPGLPPIVASEAAPVGIVLTDIAVAERLLDRRGALTHLAVLPDQPEGLAPLAEIAPELTLSAPETGAETARLTRSFHLNLTAFGLLSFAVGLFIVHGTIGLAFEQRRGLFRTLRALGVPAATLTRLALAELLALALVGGVLGLVAGYVIAGALLPGVAVTLRGLYGAPVDDALALRPGWIAAGLGLALLGTLTAGAKALWQTYRLPLLAAPGPRAWAEAAARTERGQAMAGLALLTLGPAISWAFDGLIAGFALLAGLMLGAALLLPPILGLLLSAVTRRLTGPVARWMAADLRAALPGLSLALMALLLAVATNIGVSTMVSSFRLTFTGWLDQRLAADLYVTAATDDQAAEMTAWLAPRVTAILPIRSVETRIADAPARLYGIVDDPSYRDHWPLIAAEDDVWDRVVAGQAALVNEQLARRAGLWPGSTVTLLPGWTLPVAGVYSDYGNPAGQAIVALDRLAARVPDLPFRQIGLRLGDTPAGPLATDLRAAFRLPAEAVVDQAQIKAFSLEIFERTFVVTGALNVLTLGVAAFAILTSLLTLWGMRLPQIAPVWAMGLTRAHLARLDILRSMILAALTACLAVPLGLALAWALLAVVNVEAFGWRLPMHLFPLDWLVLIGAALLAAALAALIPAIRLRRLPPATLVKVFAHDR